MPYLRERVVAYPGLTGRRRAHAHAFIDMVFGDEEQAGAVWAARRAAEATKVVPLRPQ